MGFNRRFPQYPGNDVITQIEGINIIDLTPPGAITGVGTGVACLVGEFADVTNGVTVDSSGVVSTNPQPIEIFSTADLLAKAGGFDETIGEFGKSCGNAFTELRNKKFARLVVVPVNNASSRATRLIRDLPTNRGATDPTPIIPVQAASVSAGREFKSGSNRVRAAKGSTFTADIAYASAIDGAQASNSGPAATGTLNSAGASFVVAGAQKGDILVLGVIGGSGLPGTYRVLTVAVTQLTVERLDGASFTWASATNLPYRLHTARTADSAAAGYQTSDAGGYQIPARPLDATITAGTVMAPTVAASAGSATAWDPLSGLAMVAMPGGTDLIYTAAVQASNAASAAAIDTLYGVAIDALLADASPGNEVNLLWSARKSATIAAKLKAHEVVQSAQGIGRMAVVSPALDQLSLSTVGGDSYPGIGANRDERAPYAWPGAQTSVPEAVGFNLKGSDGALYSNGILDVSADAFAVSVMSQLQPERNPGELSPTVAAALQGILGYQRGAPKLGIQEFTFMRAKGIMGLKMDRTFGPCFQSGVTSSLKKGEKNINRRRFADFVEDSLAEIAGPFNKLPVSPSFTDSFIGECDAFLSGLKSVDSPPARRLKDYKLDDKSGNTPTTEELGIFVLGVKVDMLTTADFIVLNVACGPGLDVNS